EPVSDEQALLAKLRARRAIIAKTMGNIPQWQVLHNAGIEALAREQPLSIESAMGLPGITERKRKMLDAFIALIRKHRGIA
ncbi:MAG: HRDC domain-containing protein, partial [Puniceicoccales bacterium]|nr:HRDC domain-containing protein [Puniceicoccales bacterium]